MDNKTNKFDWRKWDVPISHTPLELRERINSLNIIHKTIKSIRFLGHSFDEQYDIRDIGYLNDEDEVERTAEIDEPVVIEFEDGDTFELDFSEEHCGIKCGINSIPSYVDGNEKNCDPNIVFSEIIGSKIHKIGIEDECCGDRQCIGKIIIYTVKNTEETKNDDGIYSTNSKYYRLVFSAWYDFGEVYLYDSRNILKIKYKEIKDMLLKMHNKDKV